MQILGFLMIMFLIVAAVVVAIIIGFFQYRRVNREAKNYERGLKMVSMLIHLPPISEDLEGGTRDQRDITDEIISQAQVMYNIISSTARKGFRSKFYGQRHVSFEIVASGGVVRYYVVAPHQLVSLIRQAVAAAYPSARLEEMKDHNIFSKIGRMSGTIGGELTLKRPYAYPIATFEETHRDASRAILNALSAAGREDGAAVQFLIRPATEGWEQAGEAVIDTIREKSNGKKKKQKNSNTRGLLSALWKPPEASDYGKEDDTLAADANLSSTDKAIIDGIENKGRYPGYETMIRVVVSSNTAARSQGILNNIVAAFSLFNSPQNNGFKFILNNNIDDLVTEYIFRFFPQSATGMVLNSIELATLFHLPDQTSIPTSQVERQHSKQVDGPTQVMNEGLLLGYNEFRGVRKPIRVSTNDRRRHTYIIGQTGTGKSVLLENLAYQDMLEGRGFAFVDPHGDSVEELLGKVPRERVEDVIYFNPGDMTNPIGLNMFEYDHPDQKDFLVQEAINMLYGLYDPGHTGIVGPRLEHIFRNCALLLMADPNGGTFIDIPKCLTDPEFVRQKLKYVTDQTVIDFWTKEFPRAQQSSEAGEVTSWVISKFGPFLSNDAMRNIIGQTKSGFNIREVMDNNKILLVNLSKGKMGELNSKLLGIIFIMKFQAAAMSRADIPEHERKDFSLFVDEFQNFATESFESILSEARKYRLNLILGNQFMSQLTDKIREAIIGNVGTVISGRIGITDAELLIKKFAPTFDVDDLKSLPNHQAITSVMIQNVPSAPFSMALIPPMGESNERLRNALKELSSAKYGRPRAQVEQEIFQRLAGTATAQSPAPALGPAAAPKYTAPTSGSAFAAGNRATPSGQPPRPGGAQANRSQGGQGSADGSFLDAWMKRRAELQKVDSGPVSPANNSAGPATQAPPAEKPVVVQPQLDIAPRQDTTTQKKREVVTPSLHPGSQHDKKGSNTQSHDDDSANDPTVLRLR